MLATTLLALYSFDCSDLLDEKEPLIDQHIEHINNAYEIAITLSSEFEMEPTQERITNV